VLNTETLLNSEALVSDALLPANEGKHVGGYSTVPQRTVLAFQILHSFISLSSQTPVKDKSHVILSLLPCPQSLAGGASRRAAAAVLGMRPALAHLLVDQL